jgi:aryl-alcohol dehydrogenase-like predicted oxidoreductase
VFLATKFALRFTSGTEFTVSGKPEYVREAFERSIKKLSVDKIDLYYFHRVDSTTPVEITVAAMAELVKCVDETFASHDKVVLLSL